MSGVTIRKPGHQVGPDDAIDVAAEPWVGRGARKLDDALAAWLPRGLSVQGKRCIDVGASTGGFTQVLLARGAATVAAVDVGRDQLDPSLAADERVREFSGVSVRGLEPALVGGPAELVVADLSFVSLTTVLPDLARLVADDGTLVALIKPQFELNRAALSKQGVVRSAGDRATAVRAVLAATRAQGLRVVDVRPSPMSGGAGNHEYLMWATRAEHVTMGVDVGQDHIDALTANETAPAGGS